ncbi:DUF6503 family protein [Psychroserpens sp.]
MKLLTILVVSLFSFQCVIAQNISGSLLLEKAIQYHDPNNQWNTFNSEFDIVMEMPNSLKRISHVTINLPKEYFKVKATKDTVITEYTVDKEKCVISLNGSSEISKEDLELHNLSCDRATMYKNYYTYLYGLPMKLKDEGTNISETVKRKTFKGKEYLVLKATYDEAVGSDVWYFYFNPETFAMEIYQFFKTDENGELNPDSGEYIMLSETETIQQIKIPKIRAWYYNKDDAYLATDILKQ